MKRLTSLILCLLLLCSLCACGKSEPPEPTPEPTPTLRVYTELDKWGLLVEKRYNMDYADFGEYWSLICDNYLGDELTELLNIISACENKAFSVEAYNQQIADKRAEYDKKYGADWHFEYKECVTEPLEERAKEDFAAELEGLYDRICVLTNEAAQWGDSSWRYFAEDLGCSVETAQRIVALYAAVGERCREAQVTEAYTVSVGLNYGEEETQYDTWLYKVNGAYVSQDFIDNTLALINLIY